MRFFSPLRVPIICGGLLAGCLAVPVGAAYGQSEAIPKTSPAGTDPTYTPPLPQGTSLEQIMPPAVFKASGLKKLNAQELASLNEWLQGYRAQAEKVALEKVIPPPSPKRQTIAPVIETSIKGEFLGLKGRTRMLLANGQVWQQANSTDHYSVRLENPYCVLIRSTFGYKMLVAGLGRPFYVKQIVLE